MQQYIYVMGMKQRKISDFCTKKFMLALTSHRLFLIRNCNITFCKSSYLRNKTLGSSLCFHHPRTWSFQKFQLTAHNKKDKKRIDTFLFFMEYHFISYLRFLNQLSGRHFGWDKYRGLVIHYLHHAVNFHA